MEIFKDPNVIASCIGAAFSIVGGLAITYCNIRAKRKLKTDLEKMKFSLDEKRIEIQNSFDNQLEKIKIEYFNLYGKRLETVDEIIELYSEIDELRNKIETHLTHYNIDEGSWPKSMNELTIDFIDKTSYFVKLLREKKIFFPKDTADTIKLVTKSLIDFKDRYDSYKSESDEDIEAFMSREFLSKDFKEEFERLVEGISNLIGVRD